jgi:hypothetical protein
LFLVLIVDLMLLWWNWNTFRIIFINSFYSNF